MSSPPPLVVHIVYRLGVGGLENGLVNLINRMPVDRYRHAIICLAGYTDFAGRISRDDVPLYDLEKEPGKDFGCYVRLFGLLRRLRPQIVHTRNLGTLDCQFVAAIAGVRVRIHGEHGWDVGDLHGQLRKHVLFRRWSRLVVQHYMTVSKHMQIWLQDVIGVPAARITQIYNGIDAERFRPGTNSGRIIGPENVQDGSRFVIGSVGRLDPVKDHRTLLEAFARMLGRTVSRRRKLQLVIVGAGEMHQELAQFVRDKHIESFVTFAGETDDVPSFLRGFNLFVLPSLNEGISNTILEAMATGLPVVASNAGGNPELVVPDVTGSLFPPRDTNALEAVLTSYVSNPAMCSAHGAAGRIRAVRDFGLRAMIGKYLDLYDQSMDYFTVRQRAAG